MVEVLICADCAGTAEIVACDDAEAIEVVVATIAVVVADARIVVVAVTNTVVVPVSMPEVDVVATDPDTVLVPAGSKDPSLFSIPGAPNNPGGMIPDSPAP